MANSLPISQRIFFGFGHVLNDMCASMWFNYLLLYYHSVLSLTNLIAGTLLLVGQIADGLTTPVIGIESDRVALCSKYGKRKSWHLFGTVLVFISFVFIFNPCLVCTEHTSQWAQFAYFAPIIVIFQIGWAATQIAHLSLIPVLTPSEHERVGLTSIRYAFTVGSNFVVFGSVSALILLLDKNPVANPLERNATSTLLWHNTTLPSTASPTMTPIPQFRISERDIPTFRYLVIIAVVLGSFFSIAFHLGVKEPEEEAEGEAEAEAETEAVAVDEESLPRSEVESVVPLLASTTSNRMTASDWFKEPHFYLVAAIYICVRLITNVSQVFLTLFITDTLRLERLHIALTPLTIYAMSMLTSLTQKSFNRYLGRTLTIGFGMVTCLSFSVMIYFITPENGVWRLYVSAIILGLGTSVLMIGSLSLTADLIGSQCQTSAFVYGVMSFGDKLSNGIAVEIIQTLNPRTSHCPEDRVVYQKVEIWVVGGISVVGLLFTIILAMRRVTNLRFYRRPLYSPSVNSYNTI